MKKYQEKVLETIVKRANRGGCFEGRDIGPITQNLRGDVLVTEGYNIVVTSREVTGYEDSDIKGVTRFTMPDIPFGEAYSVALPSVETLRKFRQEVKKAHGLKSTLRCWPLYNGYGYTFIDSKFLLDALTLMPSAASCEVRYNRPFFPIHIDSFDGFEMYICPVVVSCDEPVYRAILELSREVQAATEAA